MGRSKACSVVRARLGGRSPLGMRHFVIGVKVNVNRLSVRSVYGRVLGSGAAVVGTRCCFISRPARMSWRDDRAISAEGPA